MQVHLMWIGRNKHYMEQSILKQLQQTELQILIFFDTYCKKHNLQYYVIGGALLGSVRYGGFVPWDDDIDVAMPRDDYEKLKLLWKESSSHEHFLQYAETDPNFARGIMKLRKNDTEIIERTSQNIEMNNGIYIDIFPIDFLPEFSFKKINKRANYIKRLVSLRAIRTGYLNDNYRMIKTMLKYLTFFLSNEAIDRKIDLLCQKENCSQKKYAILFLHNYCWTKQCHRIDVFGNGSACIFEGNEFVAPAKKEEFLIKTFGKDYMIEPSCNKRVSPHNYSSVKFCEGGGNTFCNQ